jgi:hypothetical protein
MALPTRFPFDWNIVALISLMAVFPAKSSSVQSVMVRGLGVAYYTASMGSGGKTLVSDISVPSHDRFEHAI